MPRSITPEDLSRSRAGYIVVDVRKSPARLQSNRTIGDALYRSHTDAINGLDSLRGQSVVVFCVHGHEVSQGVCTDLNSRGIDARYLEGGFEAWALAGLPTIAIDGQDQ
jgi:rhodanese-related sulfurtransferase